MKKRATKVIPPDGKTFTKSEPATPAVKISKAELEAAVLNPRYRFEARVKILTDKGTSRPDAEQCIRTVIATKELPTDRPHIHMTAKGEAYFVCGDVSFLVDTHDLAKAIGVNGEPDPLSRLMDSQIAEMAQAIGLKIDPFARELITIVLRGLVQNVWYRDIEQHTSEHLESNHAKRLAEYNRKLSTWRPETPASGAKKSRVASSNSKTSMMSHSFEVVKGEHASVARGREADLLAAIRGIKSPISFAQIVESAKGKLKTKQDFEVIVARFLKELIAHGAVKESK